MSQNLATANDAAGYTRARKTAVVGTLFIAWLIGYADRIAMSTSIIPIQKEFSLGAESVGYVLSAFYLSYAIMQIGGGWLSDRFGSRTVLVFCVASWSLFTGLTGMAWSLASLIAIRLLFGIGEGGFAPASSVTIAEAFPKSERARAKTFVMSGVMIGTAAGSGFIAAMIHGYGWRAAYHVLGLVGIVVAAALWLVIKKPGGPKSAGRAVPRASGAKLLQLVRTPAVWKIVLIWFFGNITALGLQSWMPSYLAKTHKIDILHIGLASAVPYLISFAGFNGVGWLLDKVGQGREALFMAGGALVSAIALALMLSTQSLGLLLAYWTLGMVAYNFVYATVFAIPLKYVPPDMVGSATGIVNFGGQMAGVVAPSTMGLLIAHYDGSFVPAFVFLLCSGLVAAGIAASWRLDRSLSGG